MTKRTSLYSLLGMSLVAWSVLLLFTRFVPPHTVAAFVIFFLLLSVALTGTCTPLTYTIGRYIFWKRRDHVTMLHAVRQSLLLSLVVTLNLLLRTFHSWSIFMALVTLVVAVIVEVLALARK